MKDTLDQYSERLLLYQAESDPNFDTQKALQSIKAQFAATPHIKRGTYVIERKVDGGNGINYRVFNNFSEVAEARVRFSGGGLIEISNVETQEKHQRKGIRTMLYDQVAEDFSTVEARLFPSLTFQSPSTERYWERVGLPKEPQYRKKPIKAVSLPILVKIKELKISEYIGSKIQSVLPR